MKSVATSRFWREFATLPARMQRQARKQYLLWQRDPGHPSLHFNMVGVWWSARGDDDFRAVGYRKGDTIYWVWIGPHDGYQKFVQRRS